jgi:hypothetical protein
MAGIVEWLNANREWLFDGAGVAIVSALAAGAIWLWRQRTKSDSGPPTTSVEKVYRSVPSAQISVDLAPFKASDKPLEVVSAPRSKSSLSPTEPAFDTEIYSLYPLPKDIYLEVMDTAPFQQAAKKQNYMGLKVQWLVLLRSISPMLVPDGRLHFAFDPIDTPSLSVFTIMPASDCPALLKLAPMGTKVWIAGEISAIGAHDFNLDQVQMRVFLP